MGAISAFEDDSCFDDKVWNFQSFTMICKYFSGETERRRGGQEPAGGEYVRAR